MARLEDLTVGSVMEGLIPGEPVTIVSTRWFGTTGIEVIFKAHQGTTGSQIQS